MSKNATEAALVEILKECQEMLGHDDGGSINGGTVPHGGVKGFQSDITPTIVRRLARRLGTPLPDEIDPQNIFVSSDKKKKLTVKEAAAAFEKLYGSKGDKR